MKKVPFLGDIEKGIDNNIKEMMGPLGALYPALKYAVIFSNPGTAMWYAAYRSVPYLASALTSQRALSLYKNVGKSIGKGIFKLGTGALKVGAKYSKQAALGLGAVTLQQSQKIINKIKEKDYNLDGFKSKINDYILDWDSTQLDNDSILDEKSLATEHFINQRANTNAFAISLLSKDIDRRAIFEKQKDAIRKRVEKEGLPQKKYDDVELESDNTLENEQSSENKKDIFAMPEPETIEFSEPMSEEDFYRKPQFVKNVSIGDNCSMIFHRTSTGYTKQIKFGDNLGAVKDISKEEYEKIISSTEKDKEKDKEKEREFELS